MTTMKHLAKKTRIVRLGNSRGIRVPSVLLEQAQLTDEVEIRVEPGRLIVSGVRRPRADWAAAARTMRSRDEDRLLDEATSTHFDDVEWRW